MFTETVYTNLQDIMNQPHTPCKDCIFGVYNDDTQEDCKLDMLNRLYNVGAEIVPAQDADSEFYIVNKRTCHNKRTQGWVTEDMETEEDVLYKLETEQRIIYDIIFYVPTNFQQTDLPLLLDSVKQVSNSKYRPKHVIISNNQKNFSPVYIHNGVANVFGAHTYVNHIMENNFGFDDSIDQTIKDVKSPYFMVFWYTHYPSEQFLTNINRYLFQDLKSFSVVLPDNKGNGMVSTKKVYDLTREYADEEHKTGYTFLQKVEILQGNSDGIITHDNLKE